MLSGQRVVTNPPAIVQGRLAIETLDPGVRRDDGLK